MGVSALRAMLARINTHHVQIVDIITDEQLRLCHTSGERRLDPVMAGGHVDGARGQLPTDHPAPAAMRRGGGPVPAARHKRCAAPQAHIVSRLKKKGGCGAPGRPSIAPAPSRTLDPALHPTVAPGPSWAPHTGCWPGWLACGRQPGRLSCAPPHGGAGDRRPGARGGAGRAP